MSDYAKTKAEYERQMAELKVRADGGDAIAALLLKRIAQTVDMLAERVFTPTSPGISLVGDDYDR